MKILRYIFMLLFSTFTQDNVVIEAGRPVEKDVNSIMVFAVTIPKTGHEVNPNVYVKKIAVTGITRTKNNIWK